MKCAFSLLRAVAPVLQAAVLTLGAAAAALAASNNIEPTPIPGMPEIKLSSANLPPRTVMTLQPERHIPDWLETDWRIGHLPPAGFDMVEKYLKAGYEVVTVNANGAWWKVGPSASLYTPQEVKEADEYMRRLVTMIHGAGAKSIFYIGPVQVPWLSPQMVKAHPDWVRIRPSGKPDPTPNFANIRSGYADWLLNQLTYVTKTYGVDGYWFDGYAPVHLHTYDEATRKAFREYSGGKDIPMPISDVPDQPMYFDISGNPLAREYMAWHEKYFVEFADRMRSAIREGNPDAVIFANHSGNRTWYFPDMYMGEYPASYSSAIDVSSVELYWDVPGDPLYQQFVYAFMQGVTHDKGAAVWIQPSEHGITGVSSPVEIQLRGLEGMGWGVRAEFVESAKREEYMRMHEENIKAREPWLVKSRAVPYIGIVASEQTRSLYARGALPLYFSHTLGAFRSILEKHWPVRVLTEYDLENANLEGVQTLVLPDVACMSDRAAEVVRRFAQNGGGVVASFETSLYDANFRKRPDFALADLFKADYVATHSVVQRTENLYLTLTSDHPIVNDPIIKASEDTAWTGGAGPPKDSGPLALVASATEVKAGDGADVLATFKTSAQDSPSYPAIIASDYGKGRVVYLPASIDKGMFFYPDRYMREMLTNACLWAAHDKKPPLEAEGPLILNATFRQQPQEKRYMVYLLNNASSWGQHSIYQKLAPLPEELNKQWGFPNQSELRGTWPIREELIPLTDIKVTCRIPGVTRATLQPENKPLKMTRTADGVTVTVPRLIMQSIVVFE